MIEEEFFAKNLALSTEFSRYVLEHPEVGEALPPNARVILLPQENPELCRINLEIAEKQRRREPDQPVVYVYIEEIAPVKSRLVHLHLETVGSEGATSKALGGIASHPELPSGMG